jgi:uncharacterized protein (TIGR02058 family)
LSRHLKGSNGKETSGGAIRHGHSIRRRDYTEAAARAIRDALWHNSLTVAEAFGYPKEAMLIDVEIGVQKPEEVDTSKLMDIFPTASLRSASSSAGSTSPSRTARA